MEVVVAVNNFRSFLNRWISPKGESRREDNVCHCGSPMVRFYSKKSYQCPQCFRSYHMDDGVEIVHQR
jgi:hypothetical protein